MSEPSVSSVPQGLSSSPLLFSIVFRSTAWLPCETFRLILQSLSHLKRNAMICLWYTRRRFMLCFPLLSNPCQNHSQFLEYIWNHKKALLILSSCASCALFALHLPFGPLREDGQTASATWTAIPSLNSTCPTENDKCRTDTFFSYATGSSSNQFVVIVLPGW